MLLLLNLLLCGWLRGKISKNFFFLDKLISGLSYVWWPALSISLYTALLSNIKLIKSVDRDKRSSLFAAVSSKGLMFHNVGALCPYYETFFSSLLTFKQNNQCWYLANFLGIILCLQASQEPIWVEHRAKGGLEALLEKKLTRTCKEKTLQLIDFHV